MNIFYVIFSCNNFVKFVSLFSLITNAIYFQGLFLPFDLHRQVGVLVSEAYLKFDANNSNEGLISKGVKQVIRRI